MFSERAVHPMAKVIKYLLDKEIRPVELLRMMDKTVSFKISGEEMLVRCKVHRLAYYLLLCQSSLTEAWG